MIETQESDLATRMDACDWAAISEHLNAYGWATLPGLLTPREANAVADLYPDDRRFRSHVIMARHGLGRGEYKYFAYPLPELIANNEDEWVEINCRLAMAPEWRRRLRTSLRESLRASPLMDAQQFVADLEAAYRGAWTRWCADQVSVNR